MKTALAFLALFSLSNAVHGENGLEAARDYLDQHSVYKQAVEPPENYESARAQISETRDPQTKFGPYIWALVKPKSGILSDAQIQKLEALIAARNDSPINWHDARNIVRVQSLLTLWEYAAARDADEVARLDKEWLAWNDLRLEYMFQEFVVKERFQRKVWAILTPEQQVKLRSGDYDHLIKKNTGHGRAFSAHKQVLRALGDPKNQTAFDQAVAKWEKKWITVHERNSAAAQFDRRREQVYHLAGEDFAVVFAKESGNAFSLFTTAERDAIRELIQAGYEDSPELRKNIAKARQKLHTKMLKTYSEHGAELLRALGEIPGP